MLPVHDQEEGLHLEFCRRHFINVRPNHYPTMKNQIIPTETQFAIFAYITLSQAARDWSWALKGLMKGEFKHRMSVLHSAEKALSDCFKKEFGEDMVSSYENEAAIWNEVATLLKTGSVADKARFVSFLKAFQDGDVKEIHPEEKEAA